MAIGSVSWYSQKRVLQLEFGETKCSKERVGAYYSFNRTIPEPLGGKMGLTGPINDKDKGSPNENANV